MARVRQFCWELIFQFFRLVFSWVSNFNFLSVYNQHAKINSGPILHYIFSSSVFTKKIITLHCIQEIVVLNDQFNLNFVNCDDTSQYKCNVRNISRDLLKSNLILKVNCLLRQAVRWKNLAILFVTTEQEQSRSQTHQRPFKGRLKFLLT